MSTIPTTAKEFEVWLEVHRAEMTTDLWDKGCRALLELRHIEQPEFKDAGPITRADVAKHLKAFTDAWQNHSKQGDEA